MASTQQTRIEVKAAAAAAAFNSMRVCWVDAMADPFRKLRMSSTVTFDSYSGSDYLTSPQPKRKERRPTVRSITITTASVSRMLTVDTAAAVGSKSQRR